jgi:hypothetical protein
MLAKDQTMSLLFLIIAWCWALPKPNALPEGIQRLQKAYPDFIVKADAKSITLQDGTVYRYDDGKKKSFQELLDQPDLEDQFRFAYPKAFPGAEGVPSMQDPGRIRFMPLFMNMYGKTQEEVRANLREITWLPKTIGSKIQVTKINGVDKKLEAISTELDQMPELKKYLEDPGGTFVWRVIKGTNRLSMHSFGMTIDINVKYSHYWQWDCKCSNEDAKLGYKNNIPKQIVDIFEKHGFIWGGKWYHYDSMHFEYRPELL